MPSGTSHLRAVVQSLADPGELVQWTHLLTVVVENDANRKRLLSVGAVRTAQELVGVLLKRYVKGSRAHRHPHSVLQVCESSRSGRSREIRCIGALDDCTPVAVGRLGDHGEG